jgi:putative sterol carrier protein
MCVYGGRAQSTPDLKGDYVMHAETPRWTEMGNGEYGPMKGMMFGRLKFSGPKMEAMGVMGPFESFLLLVGKVPGDTSVCPK